MAVSRTPQHHIIKDTTATISRLLQEELKRSGYKRVNIIDAAPKPDAIEGKLPAVCVYLYQMTIDPEGYPSGVSTEVIEVVDDAGNKREVMRRRRTWVRLDFLVSAWAQTPEDEQILLGLVIRILSDHSLVLGDRLVGETFDPGFELEVVMSSGRFDEGTLSRFWGALNQPIRPAIQVYSFVPIIPETTHDFTRVRERVIGYQNTLIGARERYPEPDPSRAPSIAERASKPAATPSGGTGGKGK